MAHGTPKRKMKDSVFTNLFQDKKYLLQLYKTLHPEDSHATEDEIEDITIKHVLVDADYNDLGFSVGNRLMILVESQSTWTYNIIIRALMYLVQTCHEYFKRTNQNQTIRICKDRNVLKEYLENREQEIVDMMMTLFDDEQILKAYKEDIARETARKTARETARETATEMIKDGELPLEKIAKYVPSLSMEELKELEAEIMSLV